MARVFFVNTGDIKFIDKEKIIVNSEAFTETRVEDIWIINNTTNRIVDINKKGVMLEIEIEQVQKLLGHIKIDTTMEYAMVNQNNVKNSHRKYIT